MDSNNGATTQVTAKQERGNVFRGLYRTLSWAYVTNGAMAFQVPEAEYRAFGYEPDYDKLSWKESYDAARAQCAWGAHKPAVNHGPSVGTRRTSIARRRSDRIIVRCPFLADGVEKRLVIIGVP